MAKEPKTFRDRLHDLSARDHVRFVYFIAEQVAHLETTPEDIRCRNSIRDCLDDNSIELDEPNTEDHGLSCAEYTSVARIAYNTAHQYTTHQLDGVYKATGFLVTAAEIAVNEVPNSGQDQIWFLEELEDPDGTFENVFLG